MPGAQLSRDLLQLIQLDFAISKLDRKLLANRKVLRLFQKHSSRSLCRFVLDALEHGFQLLSSLCIRGIS